MTDTPTGTEVATANELPAEMIRQFSQMATLIPSEEGDAVESILAQIMQSASWADLDQPWQSSGADDLEGVTFRIDRLMRRPSRYRDGLGIFLVVHCVRGEGGERFVWTTSATAVCAQLIAAYARDWLPLWATLVIAERETEAGYKPHHLHFYGPRHPGQVQP